MPLKFNNTDFDSLFALIGSTTKRADVGFQISGVDISNRYRATEGGDTLGYSVGYSAGASDLSTLFRALSFTPSAAPVITVQPAANTYNVGDVATVSVTATGIPDPSYQWRKNGSAINGATSSTYNFATVVADNSNAYSCYISNSAGNVTSNSVTMVVQYAPVITLNPTGASVNQGEYFAPSVAANGVPSPAYRWRLNGSNFSESAQQIGVTTPNLTMLNVGIAWAGSYDCQVYNSRGTSVSGSATLTVRYPPSIIGGNILVSSYTRYVTNVVAFDVVAAGVGPITYQWYRGAFLLPGETGTTYSFTATSPAQTAFYSVFVTNSAGTTSATTYLTVLDVPAVITGGSVTTPAYNFFVGSVANFTVTATGTNLTYAWYYNNSPTGHTTEQGPSFTAGAGSGGVYKVVVSNGSGSVQASSTLTIVYAPTITGGSIAVPSYNVSAGTDLDYNVTASGTAPLSYVWYWLGSPSGETTAQGPAFTAQLGDDGEYKVIVTNAYGSAQAASTLTVT